MDFLEARTIWLARNADNKSPTTITANASASSTVGAASGGDNQPINRSAATSTQSTLGPYGQAIETLELRRTSLFAVITQFNALFRQIDANQSSSNISSSTR